MYYVAKKREAADGVEAAAWVPTLVRWTGDPRKARLSFLGYHNDKAAGTGRALDGVEVFVDVTKLRYAQPIINHVRNRITADAQSFLYKAKPVKLSGVSGNLLEKSVDTECGLPALVWKECVFGIALRDERAKVSFMGYKDRQTTMAGKDPVTRNPRWCVNVTGILKGDQMDLFVRELLDSQVRDKKSPMHCGSVRKL